jgi:ArsR family transcriptional regulator, arsenate/arsenite/antimonite-responsive transcriptional repressor
MTVDVHSEPRHRQLSMPCGYACGVSTPAATAAPARLKARLPLVSECCAPLLREPITADQAADLARMLKALADPVRLRLVSMVAAHQGGEACVCELTEPLGLTQPTISHHLKILVDAGIFTRDKRGVWAYYALVPSALDALATVLTPPR